MRRVVAIAILVALLATMVVPVAAFAKGGPPADKKAGFTPPGQAKKADVTASSVLGTLDDAGLDEGEAAEGDESSSDSKAAAKEERKAGKAAAKAEKAATKAEIKAGKDEQKSRPVKAEVKSGPEMFGLASVDETMVSEPTTGTAPHAGKRHGIANALSRIAANIERAEARVAEGTKSHVPPGLLKVLAKFMSWLGIEAEPDPADPDAGDPDVTDPVDDGDDGNGGSEEETSTPDPGNGSEEDTATIEPDLEE